MEEAAEDSAAVPAAEASAGAAQQGEVSMAMEAIEAFIEDQKTASPVDGDRKSITFELAQEQDLLLEPVSGAQSQGDAGDVLSLAISQAPMGLQHATVSQQREKHNKSPMKGSAPRRPPFTFSGPPHVPKVHQ